MLPGHLVISLFDFMSLWEYLVEPGCALVDMSTHSQYPKYVFSSWVIRPLSQQGKNPNNLLLEIYVFVLGEKIIPPEDSFVNMYTDKGRRLYCIKERKIIRSDPFGTEIYGWRNTIGMWICIKVMWVVTLWKNPWKMLHNLPVNVSLALLWTKVESKMFTKMFVEKSVLSPLFFLSLSFLSLFFLVIFFLVREIDLVCVYSLFLVYSFFVWDNYRLFV